MRVKHGAAARHAGVAKRPVPRARGAGENSGGLLACAAECERVEARSRKVVAGAYVRETGGARTH